MFETQEEKDNYALARQLKNEVEIWIDRNFNFINISVYEKCLEEGLYENIRPIHLDEAIEWYLESADLDELRRETLEYFEGIDDPTSEELEKITVEEIKNYLREHREYDVREVLSDSGIDPYPVWSTLFEFRFAPPEEFLDKAQEVGFGVIEETEYFKATLFSKSAGHSFYSSYWIPLYLSLFPEKGEKYKNVNYSMVY